MELFATICFIVVGAILLFIGIVFTISLIIGGGDDEHGWDVVTAVCGVLGGIGFIIGGIVSTNKVVSVYDKLDCNITSFRQGNEFAIGMAKGKIYYVYDAKTKTLVDRLVEYSTIVRDEEKNPYIQIVKEFGTIHEHFEFHVPDNVIIYTV